MKIGDRDKEKAATHILPCYASKLAWPRGLPCCAW